MRLDARAPVLVFLLGAVLVAPGLVARAAGDEPVAQPLNVAVPRRFVDPESRAMTTDVLVRALRTFLSDEVCPGPLCSEGCACS